VEAVACGKLDGGRQDAPHFQGEGPLDEWGAGFGHCQQLHY